MERLYLFTLYPSILEHCPLGGTLVPSSLLTDLREHLTLCKDLKKKKKKNDTFYLYTYIQT